MPALTLTLTLTLTLIRGHDGSMPENRVAEARLVGLPESFESPCE